MFTSAQGLFTTPDASATMQVSRGTTQLVASFSKLYMVWKKFGTKLGMDEEFPEDSCTIFDDDLLNIVTKLNRSLIWHQGMTAYELIKIVKEDETEPEKENETDEQLQKRKKKADDRRVLNNILNSNLVSGGIESQHLSHFSPAAKETLIGYAQIIADQKFLKDLQAEPGKAEKTDDDEFLESIIYPGANPDTDATIQFLQKALERRDPGLARAGGEKGTRLTRYAFAVVIKFSDLLMDFQTLCDDIVTESATDRPDKI